MFNRQRQEQIQEDLTYFPAIAILGPRQVGKTTLAHALTFSRPYEFIDLENPMQLQSMANAALYLQERRDKTLIIDEVQLLPGLFSIIRYEIDQNRVPARFVLLGSASPGIVRGASESLAGRIAFSELAPLTYSEVENSYTLRQHWFRGGFPGSLLAPSANAQVRWVQNYIQTYLERDLAQLAPNLPTQNMRRLLYMLSQVHGNLINQSEIGRGLGLTQVTVSAYLDLLEGSFLIRRLKPYFINISKRLIKAPKLYFRDSGLFHYLAGIRSEAALDQSLLIGASWEGYVIEQILQQLKSGWEPYFYRTQAGAEVDLVLQSPTGTLYILEVKYSDSPKLTKGYHESIADLAPKQALVVVPGMATNYAVADNQRVMSLPLVLDEIENWV